MEKAIKWVAPALVKAAKPADETTFDPAWERYVGKYRSIWGDLQVLRYKEKLAAVGPNLPDPLLGMSTFAPVSEDTFRIETDENFGAEGELAIFEQDENGKVTRLVMGNIFMEAVDAW
jgi:hypothetical protein